MAVIKNGLYKLRPEDERDAGGGEIVIDVKETDKAFSFVLVKNTFRYSPAHIDMLFKDGKKVVNKKMGGRHPMRFANGFDDWFIIYPFQAGIPFLFEFVSEKGDAV